MKKSIPTFLTIFLVSLVSAGPVDGVQQLLSGLGEVIVIIIQFVLDTILNINSFDEFLFAKLIFFILIFLVIYVTIKKNDFFGGNESIVKIITAAISILSVRFIPNEFIQVIFLQYSTLGAAIGMFIPFIIILFFLHQSNFGPLPRKIGWFVYGVSYVAIFSYTYVDLTGMAGYIYWTGIIGIVIAFFFDRQIHAAFGDAELRKAKYGVESRRYATLKSKIEEIDHQLSIGGLPRAIEMNLERDKKYLYKQMSKILRSL
ncbi:MAG: hypothetical protein V1888_01970 [archaeon]